ncbi:hypothetical protein ABZ807_27125 [Micromonospora sp. NPDC047548]|uniref:hypothetical protein n=1 Tax=Micromonospora sp. NPDC047548 TaxID=3155624 RepID=UPI0033C8F07A
MTDDDQQHPKNQQASHHLLAADLVGDGRVDLYAGFWVLDLGHGAATMRRSGGGRGWTSLGPVTKEPELRLPRKPHPVDRPSLLIVMIICAALGVLAVSGWNGDGGRFQPIAAVLAIVLFACFLILFAVFWAGWLMRGHELWREERQETRGGDSD